jgi:hypothetical protein
VLTPEIEDRWCDLLSHIYMAIRWAKINTRHNAWDIWNHRVRAASTRGTIGEFSSRLANHFGLQSLPEEAIVLIDALQPHEDDLLDLTYREHIPVSMRAVSRAKAWKKVKFAATELPDPFTEEEDHEQHPEDTGNHRRPVANPARGRRKDRVDASPSLFDPLG